MNRLQEIEEREKKATKGPWHVSGRVRHHIKNIDNWYILEGKQLDGGFRQVADADFIATARADIPYLLARLRDAEEVIDMILSEGAYSDQEYCKAFDYAEKWREQ